MTKFRCLLGDRFIDVEAADELGAQDMAFAIHVRDLKPSDFTVWRTGAGDSWASQSDGEGK